LSVVCVSFAWIRVHSRFRIFVLNRESTPMNANSRTNDAAHAGDAVMYFESFNPWPKGQVVCHLLRSGLSASG
ncbi:MAG: hypothetical protein KDB01_17520, partial [Planctomycetaceae bacterium]|nr:hypothetical protein [Planctomycetaceae bacterium]